MTVEDFRLKEPKREGSAAVDLPGADPKGDREPGRLRSQIENLGASSTAVSKFDYVTDAASRIREWTQQRGSSTPERYDIGYDAADQVTGAVLRNTSTSAIIKQYYYGYDAGSNRTTEQPSREGEAR